MFNALRKYELVEFRHLGRGVALITVEIKPTLSQRFKGARSSRATYRGSSSSWVDLRTDMAPKTELAEWLCRTWRAQLDAESDSKARTGLK